jgi:8-oxo-dGTP pyrophosphatase MutT (NUDIX family)
MLGKWGLPMGKLHETDRTIQDAACRELCEKTGVHLQVLNHVGDCYLRFTDDGYLVSSVLAHIFAADVPKASVVLRDNMRWEKIDRFGGPDDIKGVDEIVRLAGAGKGRFFAEISRAL